MEQPPLCDYEGSDYQSSFWERGRREYEDRVEAIALRRLLPRRGNLMLELGAGAGRNTSRYVGFERIVLVDYSRTQLKQAQERLGRGERYIYVAADIYRLPFADSKFDAATMIRTLHHMTDAPKALSRVRSTLTPGSTFVLEFPNKLNLKAILRYWLGRQAWSPFSLEPVEFASLNFDFHPAAVRNWLGALGFQIRSMLTVSHFRSGLLKRVLPVGLLVSADALLQWTGAYFQLSPSVFVKAVLPGALSLLPIDVDQLFQCPDCGHAPLTMHAAQLSCKRCGHQWRYHDGIYDFRTPAAATGPDPLGGP